MTSPASHSSQIKLFISKVLNLHPSKVSVTLLSKMTPEAYAIEGDYLHILRIEPQLLPKALFGVIQDVLKGYPYNSNDAKGHIKMPGSLWLKVEEQYNALPLVVEDQAPTPSEPTIEPLHKLDKSQIGEFNINKAIEAYLDNYNSVEAVLQDASPEDIAYLANYSGYGGLGNDGKVGENVKGLLTEYYTPQEIIDTMWALAYRHGYKNGQVFEPSAGIGKFLQNNNYEAAMGCEINKHSAMIANILAKANALNYSITLKHFEENFNTKNRSVKAGNFLLKGKFDLVIGNPPYGAVGGYHMNLGEKEYTKAQNLVDYFIDRGLDLLKPDGLLVYVIGVEPKNGGEPFLKRKADFCKQSIALKADLVEAFRLPKGAIPRTQVVCDIVVFRKK
jgi:hypothetical protein